MIQNNLFEKEVVKQLDTKYSSKIKAPIYEPNNEKPYIEELYDHRKTVRLIDEINQADVTPEEKKFLIHAARRHTVFNYSKIADYYAHSSKEMQNLMEVSALVIIDFNKAIENGYVKICEDIRSQYLEEYS